MFAFRQLGSRVGLEGPECPILIFDWPIYGADGKKVHTLSTFLKRLLGFFGGGT